MEKDPEIIYSNYCQDLEISDVKIEVQIFRTKDTGWILEVVDENGTSTVWDGEFKTDEKAFEELQKSIREEGVGILSGDIVGEK